jgi:hypothetical protein
MNLLRGVSYNRYSLLLAMLLTALVCTDHIYIYIYICVCVCVCVCARARARTCVLVPRQTDYCNQWKDINGGGNLWLFPTPWNRQTTVCWGLLTGDAADFWLACTGIITCKGCVRAGTFIIVFPSNSVRGVRYGIFCSVLYMPSLLFLVLSLMSGIQVLALPRMA